MGNLLVFLNVLRLDCKRFQTLYYFVRFERFSKVMRVIRVDRYVHFSGPIFVYEIH